MALSVQRGQPQAQLPQPRNCAAVCQPAPHKREAVGQPDRANGGLHDPAKDTDHIGSIGAAPQLSPDGWHRPGRPPFQLAHRGHSTGSGRPR
jgi:hypothetical protein